MKSSIGTGRCNTLWIAAFQYAEVARAAIAGLPESDYKRALLWMPDFVVARDK